jgi:DNA-binding response OmpR family regulator
MSTPPIIIIFEPDSLISGVLRVEFSRWDFAVLLADSTKQAESYAGQVIANLTVVDVGKANLAAFEACARIRRIPGYTDRPIVLTTNERSERTKLAAEKAGATVLLEKPYSMMDLFQAVTPYVSASDPLMVAQSMRPGAAAPAMQEWKTPAASQAQSGADSALTRNKLLLPIVRGTGKKVPLYRIS